jgi:hypothetical protein
MSLGSDESRDRPSRFADPTVAHVLSTMPTFAWI